jgi:hypothetical protein
VQRSADMSTCRDMPCTAAHVTARQARDASKYFSVAPDHVLSCIESVGILCYMSRLVHGLPTFYSGNFFSPQTFPKKMWESRKHQHQNGVALGTCQQLCANHKVQFCPTLYPLQQQPFKPHVSLNSHFLRGLFTDKQLHHCAVKLSRGSHIRR